MTPAIETVSEIINRSIIGTTKIALELSDLYLDEDPSEYIKHEKFYLLAQQIHDNLSAIEASITERREMAREQVTKDLGEDGFIFSRAKIENMVDSRIATEEMMSIGKRWENL